jgi:hypothetical protein
MSDSVGPKDELDRLQDAAPARRGELHRFGAFDVTVLKRAFEPDPNGGKMRKVSFDPLVHTPDMERTAMLFTITPVDPRYPPIEREVLHDSREFGVTREQLAARGLRLSEINGKFVHVAWQPNEARLGTHVGRDGVRRPSTALVVEEVFGDEDACRRAAEAFFRRGGDVPSSEGADAPAAPPVATDAAVGADGWTDAERTERATLLAFLPAIAQGKDYAAFVAALGADARLARFFKPGDPDVAAVMAKAGIAPGA